MSRIVLCCKILTKAQAKLHEWGRANRVSFDAGKESKHVLCRENPVGSNFKILGVNIDCKLLMQDAVHDVAVECGWKLETMLRSRKFFNGLELVTLYKAHLLSFVEYRTSAIYHAASTILCSIDKVQTRMQKIAGIDDFEALFNFNLAPLKTRRDIAMLGIIHRAVIGKGPAHLHSFFRRGVPVQNPRTRSQTKRHELQLVEYRNGDHTDYVKRSILGLVSVYNLLPRAAVRAATVPLFQALLQDVVKERALAGCHDWAETFCPRIDLTIHPLLSAR